MRKTLLGGWLMLLLVGCVPTSNEKKPDSEESTSCCLSCCQQAAKESNTNEGCCSGEEPASFSEKKPELTSASKPGPASTGKVELKTLKYTELMKAVRDCKGKVVVLDIWASDCGPCKKEFPHLIDLHRKYGPDGLVCISVTVDPEERKADALKFLQSKNATLVNYHLDEEVTLWQDKWDITGIPAVFVFDRAGNRATKLTNDDPDNQFEYETDVVPLVRKLLKEKP